MSKIAEMEALLFVAGEDGLTVRQIADLLSLPPTGVIQSLEKLAQKYEQDQDSSMALLETASTYKLVTKSQYAELLREYSKSPMNQSLSRAALETLSIIAYKQPITRIEVDDIRGVNSSGAISKLLSFELIREDGKKEVIGRPNLYVTTDYFLDYMGINHLEVRKVNYLQKEQRKSMRINKYIAHAGVASRRKAEELIRQGLVTVNGQVVRELATIIKSGDLVEVEGQPIYNEEKVYYLLNKPRGVISSVSDDKGRPTVIDLLPQVKERIYPVGRLDWDTSGVLILTNDGDFTDEMIHPRNEIDKVYVARVKGLANKENLRPLTRGVTIDGKKTKPATYEILKVDPEKNRSVVQLTIHEGRNHQVKKMFEAVGLLVDKLSRTQFGNLDVSGLRPGEYRRLNKKEISQLHTLAVTKTKK